MGKLIVKQKMFSIGDAFYVMNDRGEDVYQVKGSILSWGKKYSIMDIQGREQSRIEQKMLSFMPKFSVYLENCHVATIKKEFSLLRPKYNIDAGNIHVNGDFLGMNFTLTQNGKKIGEVNKAFLKLTDTYEINVFDDSLELMVLTLVITIDFVNANNNNNNG